MSASRRLLEWDGPDSTSSSVREKPSGFFFYGFVMAFIVFDCFYCLLVFVICFVIFIDLYGYLLFLKIVLSCPYHAFNKTKIENLNKAIKTHEQKQLKKTY